MEVNKSQIVVVGGVDKGHVTVDGSCISVSERMRFLGIGITSSG